MPFRRPLVVLASLVAASLVACGGSDGSTASPPASPSSSSTTTTPPASPDPSEPADAPADPIPAGIPALSAFGNGADQPIDLSCIGSPLPAATGTPTDREFHMVALGGTDADRVPDAKIDIFYDNQLKMPPDVSTTSGDTSANGVFTAAVAAPGFIAYRVVNPPTGYLPIYATDLEVPASGPVMPAIPSESTVQVLSTLIGGSDYSPTMGDGRAVVRVVDCQYHTVANAHVTIEVDGAATKPGKNDGIRRGYFTDAEFPGTAAWTSRSGVVAFLEIPAGTRTVRMIARGMVGGVERVIAVRNVPMLANGIATAKMFPFTTP
jgi:hypothetical protein